MIGQLNEVWWSVSGFTPNAVRVAEELTPASSSGWNDTRFGRRCLFRPRGFRIRRWLSLPAAWKWPVYRR